MQFIVEGQRIATENFVPGRLYTILYKTETQVNLTCISTGAGCVTFKGEAPINLFTLSMRNADTIDTIEPTQLGTNNYNNLINKPAINGVDLIGNKTSAALGIREVPEAIETDNGKILTASSDGTYTWQPAPSSGTMDYTELNNKPQINSVTLIGNISLDDLGAAAASDIPTTPGDIGAEPAITSENMLDADLVDDTSSTHKFATAAQLSQIETNKNNISTLNTAISPTVFQQPTIDSAISEICTIGSGGYITLGNIVILNLRFVTTGTIVSASRMFQLPAPLADSGLSDGAGVVSCPITNINGNDSRVIFMTKGGNILNPTNGSVLPAGTYLISACYVKQ